MTTDEAPVKQMSYKEALDYAIFCLNTFAHPEGSSTHDVIDLETRCEEVVATLADMREVVQGTPPAAAVRISDDTVTHWGCRLPGGVIRWDPGYGSGVPEPYTETQARGDVHHTPGSTLVTRTERVVVTTTAWKIA